LTGHPVFHPAADLIWSPAGHGCTPDGARNIFGFVPGTKMLRLKASMQIQLDKILIGVKLIHSK
jgi:hypothetical protein